MTLKIQIYFGSACVSHRWAYIQFLMEFHKWGGNYSNEQGPENQNASPWDK